jgi:hypothetical protein
MERFSNRGSAEMLRHVLAEEDVPAVVERDHRDGGWVVLVAEAASDDADRALRNRTAMATGIDWEDFDPGEISPGDARILGTIALRRRLTRGMLRIATVLVLGMVLIGLLAMVLELLPFKGSPAADQDGPGPASRELSDES